MVPPPDRATAVRLIKPIKAKASNPMQNNSVEVGRFLVSPMTSRGSDGLFVASVSIRSGRGMASVDRVMRFKASFATPTAALSYATVEGKAWAEQH